MERITVMKYQRRKYRHGLKNGNSVLKPMKRFVKRAFDFIFKLIGDLKSKAVSDNGESVLLSRISA